MRASLSNKYARALVEIAGGLKDQQAVLTELREFCDLFGSHPELGEALSNPAIPFPVKRKVIEGITGKLGTRKIVLNFLLVVLENGRIGSLPRLVQAVEEVIDENRGVVRARLDSASELDDAEKKQLETAISRLTGCEVRVDFQVAPELIGGLRLQIGSEIFDGSIRTQLEVIQRELVQEWSS